MNVAGAGLPTSRVKPGMEPFNRWCCGQRRRKCGGHRRQTIANGASAVGGAIANGASAVGGAVANGASAVAKRRSCCQQCSGRQRTSRLELADRLTARRHRRRCPNSQLFTTTRAEGRAAGFSDRHESTSAHSFGGSSDRDVASLAIPQRLLLSIGKHRRLWNGSTLVKLERNHPKAEQIRRRLRTMRAGMPQLWRHVHRRANQNPPTASRTLHAPDTDDSPVAAGDQASSSVRTSRRFPALPLDPSLRPPGGSCSVSAPSSRSADRSASTPPVVLAGCVGMSAVSAKPSSPKSKSRSSVSNQSGPAPAFQCFPPAGPPPPESAASAPATAAGLHFRHQKRHPKVRQLHKRQRRLLPANKTLSGFRSVNHKPTFPSIVKYGVVKGWLLLTETEIYLCD